MTKSLHHGSEHRKLAEATVEILRLRRVLEDARDLLEALKHAEGWARGSAADHGLKRVKAALKAK